MRSECVNSMRKAGYNVIHKSTFRPSGFNKKELFVFYATFVLLFLTGIVWLYFDYFVSVKSMIGQVKHPAQAWWLKGHGFFAILFTFLFGFIYGVHIKRTWPMQKRRKSGLFLVGLLCLISVTGFLLYYAGDETLRSYSSYIHWVLGLCVPIVLVRHIRFR